MNHYEGKLICDFCPTSSSEVKKSFENADVFKDHLSQVHQVGKITPVGTGTRDMEVHNEAQSGQCSVCETTFVGAQELYEHLDECVVSAVQRAAKCEGETTATPSPRGLDVDPVFPSWNVEQPLAPQRLSDYTFSYVYDGDVSDREQFGMSRYMSARTVDSAYYSIGSAAIDEAEVMDSPADPFIVQETEMSAALTIPTTAERHTYARARKRNRIQQTAVERRYRENLNAHLERLHQSVPYVASRLPSGNAAARPSEMSAAIGEGAKRSKCEILNSAIEYIKALESDLAAFKRENVDLGAPAQVLHVVSEGQGQGWHMGGLGGRGGHGE
ncbi:hypothetical protein B0A48_06321 [Cryoendolithus antarcticus]|uniref:BHLH domain-containing protein n=1 Tax=Cryoendolithus antarcticus TaxID=1507870 RepID=A0A1V8TB23_9PEZI|nr:hypothetical protein B0A48_06321 [Cryoendolithus antarcticus]